MTTFIKNMTAALRPALCSGRMKSFTASHIVAETAVFVCVCKLQGRTSCHSGKKRIFWGVTCPHISSGFSPPHLCLGLSFYLCLFFHLSISLLSACFLVLFFFLFCFLIFLRYLSCSSFRVLGCFHFCCFLGSFFVLSDPVLLCLLCWFLFYFLISFLPLFAF